MNYGEGGLSASDVALLTGRNGNNSGAGFGNGEGAWWIIIFLIFAFLGWGNGGLGRGGSGSSGDSGNGGVMDAYVLSSDFGSLQRQIGDGFNTLGRDINTVNSGLCNGFYENARLTDGVNQNIATTTAALQSTLCQGFYGVNTGVLTNGYETRNAISNVASQLAQCCCDIRQEIASTSCATQRGIDGINYNMAMNTNNLQNTMCNNTRDIIDSQNCGTRAILDAITQNRIEDKNAQIAAQQNEINALRLSASQSAQNNYLVNTLRPTAVPAYLTCNPYQSYYPITPFNNNGCGCNCGC